jgi:hypothetical protein
LLEALQQDRALVGQGLCGWIYDRALDSENPLHRAVLEQNARMVERFHEVREPVILPDFSNESRLGPPQFSDWAPPMASFQLSKDELQVLEQSGEPRLMAAAALRDRARLGELSREHPKDRWLAKLAVWQRISRENEWHGAEDGRLQNWQHLREWKAAEPNDGAPHLLEAVLYLRAGLHEYAATSLGATAVAPDFWTPGNTLRAYLIQAAELVGWPPYSSRRLALRRLLSILPIERVRQLLATEGPATAAQSLGRRWSNERLLIEQIVGYNLLSASLERDPEPVLQAEVDTWRLRMQEARSWFARIERDQLTEQEWVEYFDRVFATGELVAMEGLRAGGLEPSGTATPLF